MIRFIETTKGHVNLAHVHSADWSREKKAHRLYDAKGGYLGDAYLHGDSFLAVTAPVIPAAPGAHAVVIYGDADGMWVEKPSIVGWRLDGAGADPVFVDDLGSSELLMILLPDADGAMRIPYNCRYENLDRAMAAAREELEHKIAASAEKIGARQ